MYIVIPTYNRLSHTVTSLRSVIQDLERSKGEHFLVVVDNASKDGTLPAIKLMKDHSPVKFELISYNFNIGKAKAVNVAVETYGCDYSTICSFDGDLVIADRRDSFFDRMEEVYLAVRMCKENTSKMSFSVLCSNLSGNDAHNKHLLKGCYVSPFGNILYNPRGGSGVAGGCLVVGADIFAAVGGYRTNLGVYGGNDGYLTNDIMKKYPSAMIGMTESLSVYHPFENDADYEIYKKDTIDSIRKTGFGTTRGYYESHNGNSQ